MELELKQPRDQKFHALAWAIQAPPGYLFKKPASGLLLVPQGYQACACLRGFALAVCSLYLATLNRGSFSCFIQDSS